MIFFDAAGTLFEINGSVGEIYASLARKYGKDIEPHRLQQNFIQVFSYHSPLALAPSLAACERSRKEREWWFSIVESTWREFGEFPKLSEYFEEVFDFFSRPSAWKLRPSTIEALENLLSQNYRLGIISNFDSRLYPLLRGLKLEKFFDSISISSEVGFAKPHPEIFLRALQKNHLMADRTVMVGDHLFEDMAGAEAVGMHAILFDPEPDHVSGVVKNRIASFTEILNYL